MNYISNFYDFSQSLVENQVIEEINQINNEIESLNESVVKQVLGWGFFPVLSLVNLAIQYTQKKKKIEAKIAKQKDPAKKEALKKELEAISYEELKQREKIENQKKDMADKARAAKKEMTPEEREKYKKQKAKMDKKLEKQKQKLRKIQNSSAFSQGFV